MASPGEDAVAMVTSTEEQAVVKEELEDEKPHLSHKDVMDKVRTELTELIKADSLLCDLPGEATLEEVKSQIALEYGQAMTVFVRREDDQVMPIVVTQNATVQDLKHSIRRYVSLKLSREGGVKCISWRYIWKRYWIYFDGQKLSDNKKLLKEFGIHNKCEVTFRKRLVKKGMEDLY